MAKVVLTDMGLRSLPPPVSGQISYWDSKLPSFGVRVSQGGSKTFVINRHNSLITIGRFPILSLAEARGEAKRLLAEFTLGRARPQSITYAQAVQLFLTEKARSKKPRTVNDYKRLLNRLPFKGRLSDITHADASRQLDKFTSLGERAHLLVAGKVLFNWCIKRRFTTENPFVGLAADKSTPRARVVSDAELKSIWQACAGTFGTIVKLLILTGQRRGEIAALRAGYVAEDTITLPAHLCKNNREHTFPIETLASNLLTPLVQSSPTSFLFPARGKSGTPFNGWGNSKAALDKKSGVSGWTLHDLRRTFATKLAQLGIAPHVIERILNHVTGTLSPIALIYNRATYLEEMRAAMGLYEQHLTGLLVPD
jgi:integrase